MTDNFILTKNYVRSQVIDDQKNKKNINQTYNESSNQYNTQNIMNRSLTGNSKVEKDIQLDKQKENKIDKNIRVSRINIDSRYRNKESKNILNSQIYYLNNNPIDIVSNTINDTDIIIHQPNHGFQVNDNIILQGIKSNIVSLDNSITFIANSSYARINHYSHGLNFNTINTINIEINGFIGNINNNSDYNNIPINQINRLQQIYPTINSLEIINNNYYYILLGSIIANFSDTYNLSTITLKFNDINGINLNLLNANYPISINQLQGYQTIYYIEQNLYKIKLNINNNLTVKSCGGNSIWIASISDFIEGYANSNYYKIALKKTYYNVFKIKLVSTEFPNTEKVVKSIPTTKKNNAFYWKLLSDGDTLYSIQLPSGNYSVNLLQSTLQAEINKIKRNTLTIINQNTSNYSYYEYNNCIVIIEPQTDLFSIQFLTTIFIPNAITFKNSNNYTDNIGRLLINHPNHRLVTGSLIKIINAIITDGIPQEVLNNLFIIEKIIDENTYQLVLPKYNITASNITSTNGGNAIGIVFPVQSQLLFNKPDTIGQLIGYRNIGEPYSITNFSYINSNTDLYVYDIIDNINNYANNSINLSGDNYILMTSPIFKDNYNTGYVDNIFTKLLLAGDPGSILYNQFIQLGELLSPQISSFSEWEVFFYDALGDLYNFGNLDHSYTLEIYEDLK
jgi:hypothetical protein